MTFVPNDERPGSQFFGGPEDGLRAMVTFGPDDYIEFVRDEGRARYEADETGAMQFVGYVQPSQT